MTNITADTITDEQIEALRNEVAPMPAPRPRSEHTAEDLAIIDACDYALWSCNSNDPDAERIAGMRERARARCAEVLNARAKETK